MLQDTNSSYSIGLPNNCYHFDVCVLNGDPSFIHHLEINDLIFIISIEADCTTVLSSMLQILSLVLWMEI